MRFVASIALLVLLAMGTIVIKGPGFLSSLGFGEPAGNQGLQQVYIFSTGEGQLGALHGIRPVDNRILVDGERFDLGPQGPLGLRALRIAADGQLGSLQHFSPGERDAELERLILFIEQTPINCAVALGVAGRVEPPLGAQWDGLRARLQAFFQDLGAQSQPAAAGPCGFAYLFVRRPQGIVPLAESFSSVHGVELSFQLARQRASYDAHEVQLSRDGRMSIFLTPDAAQGEGLEEEPKLRLGPRGFNALSVPVELGQPGLMSWRLGSDAGGPLYTPLQLSFEARVGLPQGLAGAKSGVHFELLIDGQPQAERVLLDRMAGQVGWDLWSTTLDPDLHSADLVQIRITRFGPPACPPVRAYLGQPRLIAGS